MYWWIRNLIVNNRWAARHRWKRLPESLRDLLTLAMMEDPASYRTDPRWPGVRFAPGALEELDALSAEYNFKADGEE